MRVSTETQTPPQHAPSPRELDDLELLSHGALAPLSGFEGPEGLVTLHVPGDVAAAASTAGALELVDPEGVPLATVTVESTYEAGEGGEGGQVGIVGDVAPITHNEFGAFRRLFLSPEQVRKEYGEAAVTVPVAGPLTTHDIEHVREAAAGAPVVLLALVGAGTPELPGTRRWCARRSRRRTTCATPTWWRCPWPPAATRRSTTSSGSGSSSAYAPGEVVAVTGAGDLPEGVAEIVDRALPARGEQGLVLFFTGLSGSGKSTLARALHDVVLEQGDRTVTSLDGDVVRRNLSAGLTFSKEDRETNIRRIGWVAAEISRHGGVAICSPIAPFDSTRKQVRAMVEDAGGAFVLIHVATPLEECERRDRKGLYAKARRGEIPEFTGISSPYEEPEDAAVRVDTTGRTIEDALDDVLTHLREEGYLA